MSYMCVVSESLHYCKVCIQEVSVVKRTPKQVKLEKGCEASGYRTTVDPGDVYETREAAVRYAADKLVAYIATLESRAADAKEWLAGLTGDVGK